MMGTVTIDVGLFCAQSQTMAFMANLWIEFLKVMYLRIKIQSVWHIKYNAFDIYNLAFVIKAL